MLGAPGGRRINDDKTVCSSKDVVRWGLGRMHAQSKHKRAAGFGEAAGLRSFRCCSALDRGFDYQETNGQARLTSTNLANGPFFPSSFELFQGR